jgi:hypothetical protein
MTKRGPLILAIVLLFVPLLYVGSYLSMVGPWRGSDVFAGKVYAIHYRCPIIHPYATRVIFRPIQLVDLRLRPQFWQKLAWDPNLAYVEP